MDAFISAINPPMFVVTTGTGEDKSGCLVAFATQCSATPARFLVCLSKLNHTYKIAEGATSLAVHLLGPDQRDIAELFGSLSGDEVDKFTRCSFHDGRSGVPILNDCVAFLEGRIEERVDFGDHVGFVLSPLEAGSKNTSPEEMLMGEVADLTPGHPLKEETTLSEKDEPVEHEHEHPDDEIVEEADEESFPASDAPATWAGPDDAPKDTSKDH